MSQSFRVIIFNWIRNFIGKIIIILCENNTTATKRVQQYYTQVYARKLYKERKKILIDSFTEKRYFDYFKILSPNTPNTNVIININNIIIV